MCIRDRHYFPLLAVEHDCILSKNAEVTVAYRVVLPELFTLTAVTEMLREVTAENIAMQDKILHEIQLLSAIYELKYTTNQYENK